MALGRLRDVGVLAHGIDWDVSGMERHGRNTEKHWATLSRALDLLRLALRSIMERVNGMGDEGQPP